MRNVGYLIFKFELEQALLELTATYKRIIIENLG